MVTIIIGGLLFASLLVAFLELADSRGQNKLSWAVGMTDVAALIWLLS